MPRVEHGASIADKRHISKFIVEFCKVILMCCDPATGKGVR